MLLRISRLICVLGIASQLENPVGKNIEHILKRYKVDLGLWGDFHQYERTYPMYKDRRVVNEEEKESREIEGEIEADKFVNPKAPIHVVNGVGGNAEGNDILLLEGGPNTDRGFRVPSWSARR